jgi:phosphomannomutase/phosphoglucomutase
MQQHIFRQYDIRGKVGSEFSVEDSYIIARALAVYFKRHNSQLTTIAVGADGRVHSPAIKEQLCRGLLDSGLDVVYIGTCPTPVVYFAMHTMPFDAAVMITASHNGKEYNGFKIMLGKHNVWGNQLQELKKIVYDGLFLESSIQGTYEEIAVIPTYISWLKNSFTHLIGFDQPFVIDCGNGAAGTIIPDLVRAMNWDNVHQLYAEVDGTYPHHEADPVVEKNMADVKELLFTTDNAFGVGFDGDCDRMAPMAKSGELVSGDKLLALFAQSVRAQHPKGGVVFDIKCSSGLRQLLQTWGMEPIVSPSGHSNIKEQMRETGALLAGELSCHFFFKDRYFGYDDGFYAMMRLLELLQTTGKTLDQLLEVFPRMFATPELRVECLESEKIVVVNAVKTYFTQRTDVRLDTLDGIRIETDYGWSLLRASNTQAVLCLRFESDTQEGLRKLQYDLLDAIRPHFDMSLVEKELQLDK